ncbi:hypothetical protein QBC43DRAFT_312129 [Cladorrhinum sp. PSN259]|nr:hypothetical protein QBC43DRAFT_312129 [Cladorrhinum sp. PSN259]
MAAPNSTTKQTLAPPDSEASHQDDTAISSLCHIQTLWSWAAKPSKPSYPPISSIPRTTLERLSQADAQPLDKTNFPTEPILTKSAPCNARNESSTVLYLAYGSNLCAKTFLGMRGIRPLSQLNVSAPSLDLIFDLPGLPYKEPCFANTTIRKIPTKPPPIPPNLPDVPPIPPPHLQTSFGRREPVWNNGLYGVVYEVTQSDYAKIIATEGAGSSYHDIMVPCFPLPPSVSVPEKPAIPIPRPFLARTLYAPRLPAPPNDADDAPPSPARPFSSDDTDNSGDNGIPWYKRLLLPLRRPSATYAQPSARYLDLILTGAQEHEMPRDYIFYLSKLQPYTITTCRQKLGQVLFLGFWAPLLLLLMSVSKFMADKNGRAPKWVMVLSTVLMNLIWGSYDLFAKGLFGDGERTLEEEEEKEGASVRRRRGKRGSLSWRREEVTDYEEKRGLLLA